MKGIHKTGQSWCNQDSALFEDGRVFVSTNPLNIQLYKEGHSLRRRFQLCVGDGKVLTEEDERPFTLG